MVLLSIAEERTDPVRIIPLTSDVEVHDEILLGSVSLSQTSDFLSAIVFLADISQM